LGFEPVLLRNYSKSVKQLCNGIGIVLKPANSAEFVRSSISSWSYIMPTEFRLVGGKIDYPQGIIMKPVDWAKGIFPDYIKEGGKGIFLSYVKGMVILVNATEP